MGTRIGQGKDKGAQNFNGIHRAGHPPILECWPVPEPVIYELSEVKKRRQNE